MARIMVKPYLGHSQNGPVATSNRVKGTWSPKLQVCYAERRCLGMNDALIHSSRHPNPDSPDFKHYPSQHTSTGLGWYYSAVLLLNLYITTVQIIIGPHHSNS
jgi:hypothetical protein